MQAPQVSLHVALPVFPGVVSAGHSSVTSGGQVIVGAVVSTTVMIWSQLLKLPQSSSAVHVRVITSVLPQPGTELSLNDTVHVPQPSLHVATPVLAGVVSAGHSRVTSGGQVIVGA